MEYTYNLLTVDENGRVIEILYTGKRLPTFRDEMTLKPKKKCSNCGQVLKTKNYILAGNYKVGDIIK